jgi:hypothetical protein
MVRIMATRRGREQNGAAARSQHRPRCVLAGVERAIKIDPHDAVELRRRDGGEILADRNAGIADHDVGGAAEDGNGPSECRADGIGIGDIGQDYIGKPRERPFDSLTPAAFAAPGHDRCSLLEEAGDDGGTNAGRSAGDDDPLALQPIHSALPVIVRS